MKPRSTRSRQPSASDEFLGFTRSIDFDQRLWNHDIAGSIAHAHGLAKAGVLTPSEEEKMVAGLKQIAEDISKGKAVFSDSHEDIHMNVENMLTGLIGEPGKKLHTGRSRNDQVALDMRLFARAGIAGIVADTICLQKVLLQKAEQNSTVVLPGYTHMQHAQPVLLSHHLMAHFWRLQRDIARLEGCYARTNICPLGAGAMAGTSYPLDRTLYSTMLGMKDVTENSVDAVSDRDFIAESVFALSVLMIHLSSLCEELVLWSSQEFGFVRLPKDMSSGSSMMPQKRNPDLPELIRGKSGRTLGDLVAILTVLKSLPLSYNRDLQEDKEQTFDAFDTVRESLRALTPFLRMVEFDAVRMRKAAEVGLMTATDLADFLTQHGVPFRTAHGLVKQISEESSGDEKTFQRLASEMLRSVLKESTTMDASFLTLDNSIKARNVVGGTSIPSVSKQMEKAEAVLAANMKAAKDMVGPIQKETRLLD